MVTRRSPDMVLNRYSKGPTRNKPYGQWDRIAGDMLRIFAENGHLKNKGGEKTTQHFCGDSETLEAIFRTVAREELEAGVPPPVVSSLTNSHPTNNQARGNSLLDRQR